MFTEKLDKNRSENISPLVCRDREPGQPLPSGCLFFPRKTEPVPDDHDHDVDDGDNEDGDDYPIG